MTSRNVQMLLEEKKKNGVGLDMFAPFLSLNGKKGNNSGINKSKREKIP